MWQGSNGLIMSAFITIVVLLLMVNSVHSSKTRSGLDFSQDYSSWKAHIEDPFVSFLNKIFCVCQLLCTLYIHLLISISAHEIHQPCTLAGTMATQAPSDLSGEDELCKVMNTSIAANTLAPSNNVTSRTR